MYCFNGYNENTLTFALSGEANAGDLMKLTASETVATAGTAGDTFCGVAKTVRNGAVSVQLNGYIEMPYTGTAPAVGKGILAANGNGGVKSAESGTDVLIIKVDTANKMCGFII